MSQRLECRISRYQLRAGVLQVPRRTVSIVFPKGEEKVPVKVYFDDGTNPTILTYSPYYYLLYGLKKWHQSRNAEVGDIIVIEPIDSRSSPPVYRLRLEKSETAKL